ncbi:GDP-L-fucose synthase [Candidatus Micrarchaeota archaeon]|nr:GDP-L-fucose synthase [Candidatus Micrarchaeota archaeon]
MPSLKDKSVLITGAHGFLGRHVVAELKKHSPSEIIAPKRDECDFRKREEVDALLSSKMPAFVIHLAGRVGGIGETKAHPGGFFFDNASMALNLIDSSYQNGVEKFVGLGSVCSYPKFAPIPFRESDLWEGYPEETNAPYGLAKKMMMVHTQAYSEEYGFNGIHLLGVNLYGPHDNFHPESSHVIAGMIRKFTDAKEAGSREVVFWGDGSPTREFLYVEDCARGIVLAAEKYDSPAPINLGSGMEISIHELAQKLKTLTGFVGEITWDTSRPNGQPRRCLDVSLAEKEFGFKAQVGFDEGLKRTVEWYVNAKKEGEIQ